MIKDYRRAFCQKEQKDYLYTCFCQVYLHGNLLTRVDVGIMGLLKRPFQFFELGGGECRSDTPLFPFLRENSIMVAGINFVG